MKKATVNGVELEYEVKGSGEPVFLIPTGPIADSFRPFVTEEALAGRYQLIAYHQRGQAGSTRTPPPVSFAEHAADAAALLGYLGIGRAHIAGHSTGAVTALQLALDYPDLVHSLAVLEPPLMSVAGAAAFLEKVGPSVATYSEGRLEEAIAGFISVVCSLEWEECSRLIDKHTPGGTAQVFRDADNVFSTLLPALGGWEFGPEQAGRLSQPVLSVLGTDSERLFRESDEMLHLWMPQVEDCRVNGVAHLLHLQRPEPVVQRVAAFFARHPMSQPGSRSPSPRVGTRSSS
jgi:pimeloyl-ACP methyl ester carboxylesterase